MLDIERTRGVRILTLHHGKVNALDLELLQAISAAVRDGANDALVITGAGRAFTAGVDLRRIVQGGPAYVEKFLPALSDCFLSIFDHPRPVVAAVNGHAIAGGCVIAAASDLRLMSAGSIGLAELRVGVPFPTSAMEILRSAIGHFAERLILTGEFLTPAAAASVGLIDQVVTPSELVSEAIGWASRLSKIPAEVFSLTKRQLHEPATVRIRAHQDGTDAEVAECWTSDRVRTAIADYLEALGT